MKLIGLTIYITVILLGLSYVVIRFFLYAWRGFKKKDIVIYSEYQEFDTRVKGFWARVWAVCVMIFVAAVSVVLLMALVWMLWQRK